MGREEHWTGDQRKAQRQREEFYNSADFSPLGLG